MAGETVRQVTTKERNGPVARPSARRSRLEQEKDEEEDRSEELEESEGSEEPKAESSDVDMA